MCLYSLAIRLLQAVHFQSAPVGNGFWALVNLLLELGQGDCFDRSTEVAQCWSTVVKPRGPGSGTMYLGSGGTAGNGVTCQLSLLRTN